MVWVHSRHKLHTYNPSTNHTDMQNLQFTHYAVSSGLVYVLIVYYEEYRQVYMTVNTPLYLSLSGSVCVRVCVRV